jgi:polar amino acid transport system substrate-binding protein
MMSYPIALPECRKIIMLFHARQIGLLITLFIVAGFASSETLVLNNSTDPPLTSEHGTGFLDRLAQEAFRRAGLELKLVKLPAERALRNANSGIEDGDLNRIAGIENTYTNLVRVPEKSMDMEFTAFTRQTSTSTVDWQQLSNYRVGIIKGWKILELNLQNPRIIIQVTDSSL